MSVREGERKTSNLKYVQDAHKLCDYTLTICNNPKYFPDNTLAKAIKYEVCEILSNVRYNLATYINEKNNKQLLKRYTCDALAHIDALYGLLEIAYNNNTYNIPAKTAEYWVGLIIELENSIRILGSVPIC